MGQKHNRPEITFDILEVNLKSLDEMKIILVSDLNLARFNRCSYYSLKNSFIDEIYSSEGRNKYEDHRKRGECFCVFKKMLE